MDKTKDSVQSTGPISITKRLLHRQLVCFYNDVAVTSDWFYRAAADYRYLFVSIKGCQCSRHFQNKKRAVKKTKIPVNKAKIIKDLRQCNPNLSNLKHGHQH